MSVMPETLTVSRGRGREHILCSKNGAPIIACRGDDGDALAARTALRYNAHDNLLAACEQAVEDHTMPAEDDMNDSGEPWCTSCDSPVAECCCSMARGREAVALAQPNAPTD